MNIKIIIIVIESNRIESESNRIRIVKNLIESNRIESNRIESNRIESKHQQHTSYTIYLSLDDKLITQYSNNYPEKT
jgi:hypothetical protein